MALGIGFKIDRAKGLFFDSRAVLSRTDRATRRVLSRFGAFVRQRARSSIRKRRRISRPGEPPSSHVGLVRRFLFFVFEPSRSSVVIGPAQLNRGDEDALDMLEHGGRTVRRVGGRRRRVTYRARPFMGPAFEAEQPQLPALWRDSIV